MLGKRWDRSRFNFKGSKITTLKCEQANKSNKFKNAFATYKLATSNKMHIGGMSSDSPIPTYNPGLGSSFEAAKVLRLDEEYR